MSEFTDVCPLNVTFEYKFVNLSAIFKNKKKTQKGDGTMAGAWLAKDRDTHAATGRVICQIFTNRTTGF